MKLWQKNMIIIIVIVIIAIVPLLVLRDAEFEGADDQAEDVIVEVSPEYEPWAELPMEPPSGEIESLLFSLQAAIGAGVICFILGRMTAKPKKSESGDNS